MYNCSYTTRYTYANQLISSTTDGKVTEYAYDAAGRLIKEGDKSYAYGWLDKVLSVTENGQQIASFNYHNDGQIAQAIHDGKSEDFLWDGLALIHGNWCHSSEMSVGKGVVVKLFLLPYRCSYDTIVTDCDICVSAVPYCGNNHCQNKSTAE